MLGMDRKAGPWNAPVGTVQTKQRLQVNSRHPQQEAPDRQAADRSAAAAGLARGLLLLLADVAVNQCNPAPSEPGISLGNPFCLITQSLGCLRAAATAAGTDHLAAAPTTAHAQLDTRRHSHGAGFRSFPSYQPPEGGPSAAALQTLFHQHSSS